MTLTKVRDRGTTGISTDLSGVNNSLSRLGLRVIANQNLAGINGNDISYDTFQDSTKITNLTGVARDDNEFISSQYGSLYVRQNLVSLTAGGGNNGGVVDTDQALALTRSRDAVEGATADTGSYTSFMYTVASSTQAYARADLGASYLISQFILGKSRGWGDGRGIHLKYSTTSADPFASGGYDVDLSGASATVYSSKGSETAILSNFSSSGTADWSAISTNGNGVTNKINGFTPFTARYVAWKFTSADFHDANAGWNEFDIYKSTVVANATGSFEGTTITAPASTNKMGAVITYTDSSGTASLNTDLILDLSADNGSNYNRATLTALPDFASGVKCCKVNDLDITNAGTQLKYKISFQNQSSGSKVTRVTGVSLQY